jgi:PAS domain S-box-containing protein
MTGDQEKKFYVEELPNERLKSLFDKMPLGVVYYDKKKGVTDVNPAALEILGLSLNQIQGRTAFDPKWKPIHMDGSQFKQENHPSMIALRTGKPVLGQIMGVTNLNEKKYRWIQIDAIPEFKPKAKEPHQVCVFFKDVTDIREAESKILEDQKRIEKTQKLGKLGDWTYHFKTKEIWASLEVYRILGISSKPQNLHLEFLKSRITEFDNHFKTALKLSKVKKAFSLEFEFNLKKETKIIRTKVEVIYDDKNVLQRLSGVLQDVTLTTLTNHRLKESEKKFFKTLKRSLAPIALIRFSDCKLLDLNRATSKLTGYTIKELKGKTISQLNIWGSKKQQLRFINKLEKKGRITNFQSSLRMKSGEKRICLISAEMTTLENEQLVLVNLQDITEKIKQQKLLKKQSDFALRLTENHPSGIASCDSNGKLILFNETAKKWHGLDVRDIDHSEWAQYYDLYNAETGKLLEPDEIPLVRAFKGEQVEKTEIIINAKNQKLRHVLCNAAPMKDDMGNITGALVVMDDITYKKNQELKLKKQEEELRKKLEKVEQSEFFFQEITKIAKTGGWTIDVRTNEIGWTEEVYNIHGLPVGELPSMEEALDFFIDGSRETLTNGIEQAINNKTKYDLHLRFQNAQKKKLWVRTIGHPVLDAQQELIGFKGIFQDITDIRSMEEEISKKQEMYNLLAQNIIDIICLFELNGTFRYITPSVEKLLGYTQSEMIGKKFSDLIHKDDLPGLKKLLSKQKIAKISKRTYDFRVVHKEGHYLWLETLSSPVYRNDELDCVVTSTRDITESVLANKKVTRYQEALQKLTTEIVNVEEKEKRRIASNIHDHLSQALVMAKMKIDQLLKQSDSQIFENLNFIKIQISNALDNSRKITSELSPPILYQLGIIEALYWLMEKYEEMYPMNFLLKTKLLNIKMPDSTAIILFRCVQELLNNAVKYSKASIIAVKIVKVKSKVIVNIIDNGIGFEPDKLHDVYDFSNGGFGLFSIKERINNLGGEFLIQSKPKEGTDIEITMHIV